MDCLFEILFQFLGELFLGAFMEALCEGIGRLIGWAFSPLMPSALAAPGSSGEASRVTRLNVGRAVLWQLAGTAAGFLSLLIMPKAIVHVPILHVFNLILTPIFMALLMVQGGRLFERSTGEAGDEKCRGLPKRSPLNHFVCAYGFALCYLLVRFAFARR